MAKFSHSACEIQLVYCVNSGSTTCFFRSRSLFLFFFFLSRITGNRHQPSQLRTAGSLSCWSLPSWECWTCVSLVCIRPWWSNSGLLAHWSCSNSYKILSVSLWGANLPTLLIKGDCNSSQMDLAKSCWSQRQLSHLLLLSLPKRCVHC